MSKEPEPSVDATDNSDSNSIVQQNPKRTWRSNIWDSLDKSPEERKFIFKLDVGLLTIACLGYFIKYLDQANLNNAFVSGMKEDLGMYGNQLNYALTTWTAGYLVGEIPSNILLTRIRPSIWLPSIQIVWTILTMCTSRATTVGQLYALRFLVGLTEAGFFPGIIYVMGSWYRKDELAKRAALFSIAGGLAGMFSGYLMTAVTNLNGTNGIKGWQWLFIMDGIISLPIALAGPFLIPDSPHNTRVFYINEKDKAIAKARIDFEGRAKKAPFTKAKVVKILTGWHLYLLPLMYIFAGAAGAGNSLPIFALYLKASQQPKYTIAQINNYPTITSAFSIVATLVYAWVSDGPLHGRRWPLLIWSSTVSFIIFVSLAAWNISTGWKWFCFIVIGQISSINATALSWGNEICADDEEERAIVVAAMNDGPYVVGIWLTLIIWQQTDAPVFKKGYITASVLSFLAIVTVFFVRYLVKRDQLKKQRRTDEVQEIDSKRASDPEIAQEKLE